MEEGIDKNAMTNKKKMTTALAFPVNYIYAKQAFIVTLCRNQDVTLDVNLKGVIQPLNTLQHSEALPSLLSCPGSSAAVPQAAVLRRKYSFVNCHTVLP